MTIEEFIKQLNEVQRTYPDEAEKAIRRGGNAMKKALAANSPISGVNHPHKLRNSWRMKFEGYTSDTMRANIYSTAPHFHLVNRGHVKKNAHGQVTGYTQGLHFVEKTVDREGRAIQESMAASLYRKLKGELDG